MTDARLHLKLFITGCILPVVIGWQDVSTEIEHLQIVEVTWGKALKPCECSQRKVDCSERALVQIQGEDRCLEMPSEVDLSYNKFSSFPDGFSSATVVNATRNTLTALPKIDQLNPQIIYLDLSVNRIENVTESFRSLHFLEVLHLSWNKEITNLNFLPRPCALKVLRAATTGLQNFEEGIRECRHLEELDIANNLLSSMSSNAFSTHLNLRRLRLSYNSIITFSSLVFVNLTRLQELNLKYNDVNYLPDHIFDSLSLLQTLDLSGNKLRLLPQGIFSKLVDLKFLDLSANQFQTLPIHAFVNLQELVELKVSNNYIKTIPDNAFLSLPNIQEVHLLKNEITAIGNNLFSNASRIRALTLSDNPLVSMPQGFFSQFPNLLFTFVPCLGQSYDWNELRHVENILIGSCGEISWPSRAYAPLARVVTLVINNNIITSIANNTLEGLPNLRFLDINKNEITSLPTPFFSYTPKLILLSLMRNNLTTLAYNLFSGLVEMKYIFLSDNHIENIPENVFQGLTAVERINLSGNRLSSIPAALFNDLPSLNEVSLEGNKLMTMPSYGSSWPQLRKISLSKNQINKVPEAALRSWLGTGEVPRHLTLIEDAGFGPDPASLRWLSQEAGVSIGRQFNCRCAGVRRGETLVFICVNATCPDEENAPSRSWVDTLRDTSEANAVAGNEVDTTSAR